MSTTLERVMDSEIEETLEMLEQQEEAGNIKISEIEWKQYVLRHEGDNVYIYHFKNPDIRQKFDDWEPALQRVKALTIADYIKQ